MSFFKCLAKGNLRTGLTICGRSICLPFSFDDGILFGEKKSLFLLGERNSKSDIRVDLVVNDTKE